MPPCERTTTSRPAAPRAALVRFPAARFQFDHRIGEGWLSDRCFLRTAATLAHDGRDPRVTLQLFARHRGVVAGLCEGVRPLETQLPGGGPREQLAPNPRLVRVEWR